MWGFRVVIPPPGRDLILTELHQTHPGISRMKSLARGYVWWPCMDSDLEAVVKSCTTCQSSHHNPLSAPVHPWPGEISKTTGPLSYEVQLKNGNVV